MKKDPKTTKSYLKLLFLTLFLDLVGFSIIFPLFPEMIQYYQKVDPENFFLKGIMDGVRSLVSFDESGSSISSIVLFGGVLGAFYSLLQFLAAPYWGQLSDRIGRRPVLLVSVFGLGLSYLLWFFAGNFTLLIFARLIGGIMGGNISTATAVVADVTDETNRSKGMAIIGISFAMGFVIGPAMGGGLSLIKLNEYFPALEAFGVNPFSMPALVAAVLSFINFIFLFFYFKESLPESARGNHKSLRSNNPLKLFMPLPFKGVNAANLGYFLYISLFSGMEFTLTFLALDRLGYSSLDNAYMFIYIGLLIALFQGVVVRRIVPKVGEVKLALVGLFSVIPGLIIIGYAYYSWMLYLGLFFLAMGSSFVVPCLTALVSLYAPQEVQGRVLGVFRSLGALGRVLGPLVAALLYWRYGAKVSYLFGAVSLIIPILIVRKLKRPKHAL